MEEVNLGTPPLGHPSRSAASSSRPAGSASGCTRAVPGASSRGSCPAAPPPEVLEGAGCPPGAVVLPRGSLRVLQDLELLPGGEHVLLRPQRVRMWLLPGEEQSFQVRFRRPEGHPPLLPFSSAGPRPRPCPQRGDPCEAAAAFRHELALSGRAGAFAERMGRLRSAANLDAPESGFDAVLQAAVCGDHLGWGSATRVLLFCSDDAWHSAGDGKLGGITRPSDTRCHLDASGHYTAEHRHDYPSVGLLAQVLEAADIQLIFAVTRPVVPLYEELSRELPRAVVRELRGDSSNVLGLLADAYEALASTVELKHSPLPPNISLSFESHCGGAPGTPRPHGGLCTGVRINQEVTFTVRARAASCPLPLSLVTLRVPGLQGALQ
ncbi:integrin beta-7-like, partial [Amazona ochrocephala]